MADLKKWRQHRAAVSARAAAKQDILADVRFRKGIEALAAEQDADPEVLLATASRYLNEMVTTNDEAFPDFSLVLSRISHRHSFEGVLEYDHEALDRLKALDGEQTLVITTAHRSYLDFLVRVPFARRGFEREYRFAGANIRFWPMGPVGHSFGISFIRRGMRDPLYAFVLRQFVGWMTEQRADFMWALEGGRTRTGKLLRPKVGLLAYVADAFVDDRSSGVTLVPTTIVYEYLDEVFEYAKYGRGAQKTGEGLTMFLNFAVRQRRVPPQAKIFVGLGEPVSLADFLERDGGRNREAFTDGIDRAALEVCRRVDAATPITAVALVLLPLLESDHVGMSVDEVLRYLEPTHRYIARRALPAPGAAARDTRDVQRALDLLRTQGLVSGSAHEGGTRYTVTPGRHIEAAYYRNSVVHHFLIPSAIELSLVRSAAAQPSERVAVFLHELERLREVLTDEFFFPDGDNFGAAVAQELAFHDVDWRSSLSSAEGPHALLDRMRPFFAPQALAPFLEAYWIIAKGLQQLGSAAVIDARSFRLNCLARAQLDLRVGRLSRPDAASLNMFDNPLEFARRRGLLDESQDVGRAAFASTVRDFMDALATLEARVPAAPLEDPTGA